MGMYVFVFECNYDWEMLVNLVYFWLLKCCIGGDFGYLVNDIVVVIFICVCYDVLYIVVVVYLFKQNNILLLVVEVIVVLLGVSVGDVLIVDQEEGLFWCIV